MEVFLYLKISWVSKGKVIYPFVKPFSITTFDIEDSGIIDNRISPLSTGYLFQRLHNKINFTIEVKRNRIHEICRETYWFYLLWLGQCVVLYILYNQTSWCKFKTQQHLKKKSTFVFRKLWVVHTNFPILRNMFKIFPNISKCSQIKKNGTLFLSNPATKNLLMSSQESELIMILVRPVLTVYYENGYPRFPVFVTFDGIPSYCTTCYTL